MNKASTSLMDHIDIQKFTIRVLAPVQDHRGESLHQGQRDPAEDVVEGGPLLLSRLHGDPPGQGIFR